MKTCALLATLSAGILSIDAHAATQPTYAPPDTWVRPVSAGDLKHAETGRRSQITLLDKQDRILLDGVESYTHIVTAIQTPQGLSDGGAVQLEWDPDTETPIIHNLLIRRGGATINALAQGQSFMVLRRENNLLDDVLDGRLTAALEPEGLQVGDVIDFAYTIKSHDPLLRGHAESIFRSPLRAHPSHLFLRQLWPAGHVVNWRETEGLDKPAVSAGKDGTELVIDMHDADPPATPEGAPPRYSQVGQLTVTDFSSWNDVTALFGPLYTQAARLTADSPLRDEVARIRAASTDPRMRAAAALQLVQGKVRYVLLAMNGGGYRPAPADETWKRRFGDCKGKTVLLVALLHELGIEAVPVLVSTDEGDGLDSRLPAAGWFDHAIVRASIDGRVYWLDGTRTGDTNIDSLQIPPYHWALPLRTPAAPGQDARLEKLDIAPLAAPDAATYIDIDATPGLFALSPARLTIVMRGDLARAFKAHAESMPYRDLRREVKQQLLRQYGLRDIQRVDIGFFESSGDEKLIADGKMEMDVGSRDAGNGRTIRVGNTGIDRVSLFEREDGPHDDAPFALPLPDYSAWKVTIDLPNNGAGFTAAGDDYDRSLAGLLLHRATHLQGSLLVVETSVKTLQAEIPAEAARQAAPELAAIARDSVTLHMPASYRWTRQDYLARGQTRLSSADDLLERGLQRIRNDDDAAGITDLSAVIAKAPSAEALANRGIAYDSTHDRQRANADFESAAQLDPHNGALWTGRGLQALADHRDQEALLDFNHAVDATPENAVALANRGMAERHLEQMDLALADFAGALRVEPNWTSVAINRWEVLLQQNQAEKALREADTWIGLHPGDAKAHLTRARLLWSLKRKVEARADVDTSIAIAPTAGAFVTRSRMVDAADLPLKLQALDRAIAIDPHLAIAHRDRGYILSAAKQYDLAVKSFDQALATDPNDDKAVSGRANAYYASGQVDLALVDISTLVGRQKDNWSWLNTRCWFRATSGKMLQEALADCDAALKIKPDAAAALDSRGFVHLRLGEYDQAISDYDAALHLRPRQPTSLLGRSIAERRKGGHEAAETDLAAARAIDPQVEAEFTKYGVQIASPGKT